MTNESAETDQPVAEDKCLGQPAAPANDDIGNVHRGMALTLRRIYNLTSDTAPRWNRKTKAKVRQMIRGMA